MVPRLVTFPDTVRVASPLEYSACTSRVVLGKLSVSRELPPWRSTRVVGDEAGAVSRICELRNWCGPLTVPPAELYWTLTMFRKVSPSTLTAPWLTRLP